MSGKVTLKADGKISISINNSSWFKASDRFRFKKLGEEIVKADFKHPNITQLLERNFQGLIEKLREATTRLKEVYINKTIEWAEKRFALATTRKNWTDEKWLIEFEVEYEIIKRHSYTWYSAKNQRSENYKRMQRGKTEDEIVLKKGKKGYIDECVDLAKRHYEESLIKLSDRLNAKGIKDETNFTIKQGRLSDNFEIEIEHNGVITRAWTIIAYGPVQCPHYRYLVK